MNNDSNSNNLPQGINNVSPFEIFDYKNLGQVRTFLNRTTNLRWFCLNDVCGVLGIKNPSDIKYRLSPGALDSIEVIDSLGRKQNMLFCLSIRVVFTKL